MLTPRYLPITSYYGHLGDTIHWSLSVYARIVSLVRNLFPAELPLHTRFNPLDSSDMEEAIGWLHRLVCDRLFPVVDGSADEFYCDVGEGELPDTLLWLTPAVFGVSYDIDTNAYSGADTRAFGIDGAVDFLMALAAKAVKDVNPHDAAHIPDIPFGIARHHYGAAPPEGFTLQAALRGCNCIALPPPYDSLPLLIRVVLKQTGNTFLDSSDAEMWEATTGWEASTGWEATIEWDDKVAIVKLTQEYQQAQQWLESIRQFDQFYDREPPTTRRTILALLIQAWQVGNGQLALLPQCI